MVASAIQSVVIGLVMYYVLPQAHNYLFLHRDNEIFDGMYIFVSSVISEYFDYNLKALMKDSERYNNQNAKQMLVENFGDDSQTSLEEAKGQFNALHSKKDVVILFQDNNSFKFEKEVYLKTVGNPSNISVLAAHSLVNTLQTALIAHWFCQFSLAELCQFLSPNFLFAESLFALPRFFFSPTFFSFFLLHFFSSSFFLLFSPVKQVE